MRNYLGCYEIIKDMILEIKEQRVIMRTVRIEWVLKVKKVALEMNDPDAKVGAPQADDDSSEPTENFHTKRFSSK